MVYIMGGLPTEYVLGTLSKHTLEAHSGNLCTDIVAVDKRRVTGHSRTLAEEFLDLVGLLLHVTGKGLFMLIVVSQ